MGAFLFIAAAVIEIALAFFSIKTRSPQQKIRDMVRVAAFAGFVLLCALSIVNWGVTYYAFAGLLLLLALSGGVRFIVGGKRFRGKRRPPKAFKPARAVWKAVGMTGLIFAAALPAILFPLYPSIKTTGPYRVATATYTYTDPNRVETYTNTGEKRKLNVELWYPELAEAGAGAKQTFPLIVFSHGSFGVKSSNESLYLELASHGYVVCSIDHTYQAMYTTDDKGNTTQIDPGFMKEISKEDAHTDKPQSYAFYQKWMNIRTGDINFVIDHIKDETQNTKADPVYKLVNSTKIGVMGHSLGGSAALGIGRMRQDVGAVIALESPFMYDIEGVKDDEFVFTDKPYPVPVLNVYSDSSWDHLGEWPQYKENYALLTEPPANAFNVHIKGVGHLSLTDFARTSPILTWVLNGKISTTSTENCLKTINKVCLEFFDSYLKGEGQFTAGEEY